jgi:tRNA 2-thiouridine synthesizing protein B
MLFTINHSPQNSNAFESALRIAPPAAPILLYEDGVYLAKAGTQNEGQVLKVLKNHPLFALDADLEARGIFKIIEGIKIISYDGFVELVEQHSVVPWF